jgi:hypothetical protein
MESQRNTTLTRLIDELGSALGDLAKWQDRSDSTRERADNTIKLLRKAFKEESYPRFFLWMAMCHIAHAIQSETVNRNVSDEGLREAWMKIGELIGKKEQPSARPTAGSESSAG